MALSYYLVTDTFVYLILNDTFSSSYLFNVGVINNTFMHITKQDP